MMKVSHWDLILTENCNFACDYCFHKADGKRMSKELIDTILEFALQPDVSEREVTFWFFGGEPLLNWSSLTHMVKHASEFGNFNVTYGLTTNGYLLNDERIDFLEKHDFAVVYSFDGETHDKHRRSVTGESTSAVVLMNAAKLLATRIGPSVTCAMSVVPGDTDRIFANVRSAYLAGFPCVALNKIVDGYKNYTVQDFENIYKEFSNIAEWAAKRKDFTVQFLDKTARAGPGYQREDFTCGAAKRSLAIGVDGRIFVCHRAIIFDDLCIGDVARGIDPLKRQCFRQMKPQKCKNCYVNPCSWCPVINRIRTSSYLSVPTQYCTFEMIRYRAGMELKRLRECQTTR